MLYLLICFSSVQFSRSFMSNSLWPYRLQHNRHPCPSPPPKAYSNSCPSSWGCHPTISSSVIPFSPSILPSIRVFSIESVLHIRWANYWSFNFSSVLSINIQDWFPLRWTGWISLQSKGLSESSPVPQFESINSSALSLLYGPTLISVHDYWK